jgi:hypothetical protein
MIFSRKTGLLTWLLYKARSERAGLKQAIAEDREKTITAICKRAITMVMDSMLS